MWQSLANTCLCKNCFNHSDTKLWDIIAEVVKLCMHPSPLNPFAVDFKYFEGLPLVQRVIATGAMAHFLQKVVASGDHAYNARGTEYVLFECVVPEHIHTSAMKGLSKVPWPLEFLILSEGETIICIFAGTTHCLRWINEILSVYSDKIKLNWL